MSPNNHLLNWNDFVELYDWEFDLLCHEQKEDVSFYLSMAEQFPGNILEIGAGTGRITLPLLKKGFHVTAVEPAEKFMAVLTEKAKSYDHFKPLLTDVRSLEESGRYALIIFSYSTFQYLLTREEQLLVLNKINSLMDQNSRLIIDISPYTAGGDSMPDLYPLYEHYHEGIKANVRMLTSYLIDDEHLIQHWSDVYQIRYDSGDYDEFHHYLSLRRIEINEMIDLLNQSGLETVSLFGDFAKREIDDDTSNRIFVVRQKK